MSLEHQLENLVQQTYRADIDGLRAFAVLGVVFFHFGLFGFTGGFVGVDVFFVISGYLITKQIVGKLGREEFSFKTFYIRRLRRLFPAFAAMICFSLIAGFLVFSPDHLLALAKSAISSLLSISNMFFWYETGYFDEASLSKPLLHTWTLSVEEQYYLIAPIVLYGAWKYLSKRTWIVLGSVLFIGPIVAAEYFYAIDSAAAFYWLPFRISEFVLGALIIVAERKFPSVNYRSANIVFLLGLIGIIVAMLWFTEETRFPGISALLPCFGAALMVWSNPQGRLRLITQNRAANWVGLVSYSLYLWHWPVLVFYKYWKFTPPTFLEEVALLVVSLGFAWGSYRFIEQPFRSEKKQSKHPHRTYVVSCSTVVLMLMLSSVYIYQNEGLPWRLDGMPTVYAQQGKAVPGRECFGKAPPLFECISGKRDKSEAKKLFLLGDSHGWALRSGITDLLKDEYLVINAHQAACPPIFGGYDILKNHNNISKCGSINKKYLKYIEQGDVFVLAARWALYLDGNPAGLEDLNGETFLLTKNRSMQATPDKSERWFEEGLRETIAMLLQKNKQVIVIGQVPPIGINPVPCLSRPSYLIRNINDSGDCRYLNKNQVLERISKSNDIIQSVTEELGVLSLIPSDVMCIDGRSYCDIFNENKDLLYRDDDHLNIFGSNYLMQKFEKEVASYLSASKI